jgi:hypothetical protein
MCMRMPDAGDQEVDIEKERPRNEERQLARTTTVFFTGDGRIRIVLHSLNRSPVFNTYAD